MLSLDKLFENLDIHVHPFAICCVEADTALSLGPREESTIHYVLGGEGTLSFTGYPPMHVRAGAMIVAPSHSTHRLTGTGSTAALPAAVRQCQAVSADLVELGRRAGDLTDGIAMVCGSVDATYQGLDSVFEYLPEPIMVQSREGDVIARNFESILGELTQPRPGSKAMLRLLFQQCFIELLRLHGASSECRLPWLLALERPRLNRAVEQIIDDPGRPYTLELLADICGMSRSSFAAQFSEGFGRSAMEFVKEMRMRMAARLLIHTDMPVKTIAGRVGYDSRSHFSRAFREFFSLAPAAYRDTHGSAP